MYPMNIFSPTEYVSHMVDYDFKAAYARGKRLILFDIDNTLVPHDAPIDKAALTLINKLKDMGFELACVSNNNKNRVLTFARASQIGYVYLAQKPKASGFIKAMQDAGFGAKETLFFGDQIFTDIVGANRAHIDSVLVEPVDRASEPPHIVLKRFLEWPILKCLLLSKRLK